MQSADPLEYDVIVVGTGAAGLTAAVTASLRGLSVLVLEKTDKFGGTTAYSGGEIWIPANHIVEQADMGWVLPKIGLADSVEKAKIYLMQLVGPTVKPERIDAYLHNGPQMIRELEDKIGLKWLHHPLPDYYSELVGGISYGRTIEPAPFDGAKLGAELADLRSASPAFDVPLGAMTSMEGINLSFGLGDKRGPKALRAIIARAIKAKFTGAKPLACGRSLLAQLRLAIKQRGAPLWLSTPVTALITESQGSDQRVVGVEAARNGEKVVLRARRGVVLAMGGFAGSQKMRDKYLPKPTDAEWSLAPRDGQDGDGLTLAEQVGAELRNTEKAWGFPTAVLPDRHGKLQPMMALYERMKPGTIVVNNKGMRYVDECKTYEDTWKAMYAQDAKDASTIPSYLIFDGRVKKKYAMFFSPPIVPFPKHWMQPGLIRKANSLAELAALIDIPPANLEASVARFNEMALKGKDEDFGRGRTAFGRYFGDATFDNPNLGPLKDAPFYAVPIWPGDLGTKGGVSINEYAEALRADGSVIPGLFACGNTSASVMGDTYPGAGGTIGPAMTLGYIAANRMAGTN
jgi:3-oxosteroid 1-dehydrogenase